MLKLLTSKVNLFLVFLAFCCLTTIYLSSALFTSNWEKLTEGLHSHTSPFLSIVFFDSETGIAINSSAIMQTNNSGKTWATVYGGEDIAFDALAFVNEQRGYIVGSEKKKPLILKTENKGLHWQKVDVDEKILNEINGNFTRFFDICFDKSGKSWLVGDGGIVEAKIDRESFQVSRIIPTKETLLSVSCNESGEVWAVGEHGTVLHYQNDWIREAIGNSSLLTKVKVINNEVWILGGISSEGVLLRSQDNGKSWENKTPASADTLFDLYLDGKQGWLIGANGKIFYTDNNGNSWAKSISPTKNDLVKIFFTNDTNGWIAGDKATILKYRN